MRRRSIRLDPLLRRCEVTGGRLPIRVPPRPAGGRLPCRTRAPGPPTSSPLREGPMNTGTDWMEQAPPAGSTSCAAPGRPTPARRPRATTAADCRWCPVCQAAAVVRGERPEVTAALADVLTTAATALRTFAAEHGVPEAVAETDAEPREREDRDPPAAPADRRSRDRRRRGRAAPRSASTSAAPRSPAAWSPRTARSSRRPAGPPPVRRSATPRTPSPPSSRSSPRGHDGDLVGVGVGAAGWFDRTGDTVLFSPHLAWRNSTAAQGPRRPAAAAALGGQRRRRRRLGGVPLRRGAGAPTSR